MNADQWNERYSTPDYIFGTEPNEFLRDSAALIPSGPVLCLADGEGRNGVFLAQRGHAVTSLDMSAVALEKARRLAQAKGVSISTQVADLADYTIEREAWAGIVCIFLHLPVPLRQTLFAAAAAGLRPGGVFILEAYTVDQLKHGTGGPKDPDLLMSRAVIAELPGLEILTARETERIIVEGAAHTGMGAVVQVIARQP